MLVCLPNSRHGNKTSMFAFPVEIWYERLDLWPAEFLDFKSYNDDRPRVELVPNFCIFNSISVHEAESDFFKLAYLLGYHSYLWPFVLP